MEAGDILTKTLPSGMLVRPAWLMPVRQGFRHRGHNPDKDASFRDACAGFRPPGSRGGGINGAERSLIAFRLRGNESAMIYKPKI